MAQTTGGMSGRAASVELSTDGSTWVDAAGHATNIQVTGGDRMIGTAWTFDGDSPVVTSGKKNLFTITLTGVYTVAANEPWDMFRDAYEAESDLYIRWSPEGGTTGDEEFTSTAGIVTECPYPAAMTPQDGSPVLFTGTIIAANVTSATV